MSTTIRSTKSDMSSTGQPVAEHAAAYRVAADLLQRWLALLGVVLCALQVGLAALGFWEGDLGGGTESAFRAGFAAHGDNGMVLSYLAVLLLILGIVSHANTKAWVLPLALAILLFAVQGPLVGLGFGVSAWFGFVHAVVGTLIMAGFAWLMLDRWRHPVGRTR